MATSLTSAPKIRAVIISEAGGQRSRENVVLTVAANTAVPSGTVLGKITATGKYVPYNNAGSGGVDVAAGVLYNSVPAQTAGGDVKVCAFVRDAELNRFELTGLDAPGETDMKALGLVVRGTAGLPSVSTPAL